MKTRTNTIGVVVMVLGLATGAWAEGLDEVLARHAEIRGGVEALAAVDTYRATGVMRLNAEMHGGMELAADFEIDWARPGSVRMEFVLQGSPFVKATDGETAWAFSPMQGQRAPERMAPADLPGLLDYADIAVGPLVDPAAQGVDVRLVGETEVEGTDAYELAVAWPDGRTATVVLDAETALPIQIRARRSFHGTVAEWTRNLGDYKEVDGVLLPHYLEILNDAGVVLQTFDIDRIELDVSLDGRFEMPTEGGAAG